MKLNRTALAVAAALAFPATASATNGYFAHGIGVRSQAVAGVAVALPQDGLAAAVNPAGTALVGDRLDVGVNWFKPARGAEISGNAFGADGKYSGDGTSNYFIPEIGYVRQIAPAVAFGFAAYGNGGMSSDYSRNPFGAFGSTGDAGVDLAHLFLTPSLAWKPNERHALGAAVTLAYHRFEAKGLGAFDNAFVSQHPGSVTNRGHDSSVGWGVKLGWIGQITPTLSLGASWSSRVETGDFDRYKGLFAEGGGFDIPASYGIGAAWKVTPALTLATDWQRIEYGDVKSVGNSLQKLFAGNRLGSSDGAGFGWRDISVWKFGVVYEYDPKLTLRVGYSHAQQPIPDDQTFFNILAPGVVRDHWSIGASWKPNAGGEWSVSYTHAPKTTLHGNNSIPAAFGGGEADIHLQEDILGLAYTWKL